MTHIPQLRLSALLILLFIYSQALFAADLIKEHRIKNQIIDYIMDGDPVMLMSGSHEFLSIFMQSDSEKPKGAVIIMHGRGYHPNWPELVYPLRTGLTEHGWHTLSIQMPVL
ncbi:MAG: alpha/beta hydrolase family protein, partial [Gammaproteobacteria bacterium]|nr:alpha/beta hydrolase family protein [Gammaproteobacteria bacterium]